MAKTRKQINVGKTKITKAPWEEDRYIYDVEIGNDSLFKGTFWDIVIQAVVGIIVGIWVYNSL